MRQATKNWMDAKMMGTKNVIEKKKKGVHKAIASLITQLKDFENLIESPSACTEILNHLQLEAQKSSQEKKILGLGENQLMVSGDPMNGKMKDIDFSEIGVGNLKEMWEKVVGKEREVEGKLKEVEFNRRFVEERAMELEVRQKELDDGFRKLKLKKIEFAKKVAGIKRSKAGAVRVKQEPSSAKWDDNNHRIFTELCVDEVRKGNKPGRTLSKTGLENVQKEFNAITGKMYNRKQFKNHWDKMKEEWILFDQLRGRHAVLGWNQEKKTIVADDAWWDAQIKINPKYAKFKNKDLSVIWFNYDILFGDVVATDDSALVPVGPSDVFKLKDEDYFIDEGNGAAAFEGAEENECGDSQSSRPPGAVRAKQEPSSAKWDDNNHRIFTELCVDEVRKGNKPGRTLSKTGLENVQKEFNAITGKMYNRKQFKNHWDKMKEEWILFDQLRGRHAVLEWNQEKKTIVADDAWWDAQVKINPKYAKFKNKDLSVIWFNYDILFGDVVATDDRALVPVGPSDVFKLKVEDYFIDEGNGGAAFEGAEESECGDSQASRQPGSDDFQIPVTSERKTSSVKKRKIGAMSFKDGIDSLVNTVASKSTESSFHTADAPSIKECMDRLEEIEGIPKKTPLYWYSQNLFTRADMRTIFMKQPCDGSRVGWLEFNYSEYLNRKPA